MQWDRGSKNTKPVKAFLCLCVWFSGTIRGQKKHDSLAWFPLWKALNSNHSKEKVIIVRFFTSCVCFWCFLKIRFKQPCIIFCFNSVQLKSANDSSGETELRYLLSTGSAMIAVLWICYCKLRLFKQYKFCLHFEIWYLYLEIQILFLNSFPIYIFCQGYS